MQLTDWQALEESETIRGVPMMAAFVIKRSSTELVVKFLSHSVPQSEIVSKSSRSPAEKHSRQLNEKISP